MLERITHHGVGIGHRHEIAKGIMTNTESIPCVEIIAERYMGKYANLRQLRELSEAFKVVPHGVSLSIGSDVLDHEHLKRVKMVCDIANAEYFSDHLCVTKVPGINFGHLCPMQFTEASLEKTIANVQFVQEFIERPLVLENITYNLCIPQSTIDQTQFFKMLTEETNCGVLLDVTNVHTNSHNHGFDAKRFIDSMPLGHVVQVHLAGGFYTPEDALIDSHSMAIEPASLELFEYVNDRCDIRTVIIEHDNNFPEDFSFFLDELKIARAVYQKEKHWKTLYNEVSTRYAA